MGHKLGNSDIVNILHATDDPTPVINQVQAIYTTEDGGETYLYFDGVNDYMRPPTSSYLNFALPIKVDFLPELPLNSACYLMEKFSSLTNNNQWVMHGNQSPHNIELSWRAGNILYDGRRTTLTTGVRCVYEVVLEGTDAVHYLDGVETQRDSNVNIPSSNSLVLNIGRSDTRSDRNYKGRIYSLQIGNEVFDLNEGSGSTTTGSEGTVLSIVGATWVTVPSQFKLLWENT